MLLGNLWPVVDLFCLTMRTFVSEYGKMVCILLFSVNIQGENHGYGKSYFIGTRSKIRRNR